MDAIFFTMDISVTVFFLFAMCEHGEIQRRIKRKPVWLVRRNTRSAKPVWMVKRVTRRTQPVRRRKLTRNRRPTQIVPVPKQSNWEKFLSKRRATRNQRDASKSFFTFKCSIPEEKEDHIIQQGLPSPMDTEPIVQEEEKSCFTSSDDEILESWDFGDDYGPVGSPPSK